METDQAGWSVVYKSGDADISAALRSAQGYTTRRLVPGRSEIITIAMTPNSSVVPRTGKNATLRVFLDASGEQKQDVVRATTILRSDART